MNLILVILIVVLFALSAFSFGGEKGKMFIQRQAIERGYAQYCATTGEWAWKGECE